MKISSRRTSRNGKDKLMSSPQVFPVNHSALPEEDKERKMIVTSGQKCFVLLGKLSPVGLLAKMLLASPLWYCPVRRLRWEVTQIYSERITYKQKQQSSTSSTISVKILSQQDTKYRRSLFRLAVSMHHTEEIVSGSSLTNSQMMEIMKLFPDGMLPTPTAADASLGEIIGEQDQFVISQTGSLRKINRTGNNGSVSLARVTKILQTIYQQEDLLPTPVTRDWRGARTPECLASKGRSIKNTVPDFLSSIGNSSHLNPCFVSEMMGYPPNYMVLAFQDGERKQ